MCLLTYSPFWMSLKITILYLQQSVCVCVCVCVRVYVVYEDTNLYNNMGMTEVLQFEGGL